MGGDCTQYFKCHFEAPPTLQEFVAYVLEDKREWGSIELPHLAIEYRHGEIINVVGDYETSKDRLVSIKSKSGGWTRMDYNLTFKTWQREEH